VMNETNEQPADDPAADRAPAPVPAGP